MKLLLACLIAIGCGGSRTTGPSNTGTGSAAVAPFGGSEDCTGGGTPNLTAAECKFWGEVMGPPPEGTGGTGIHMIKCCYLTLEAACQNTGGCTVADCTAEGDTPQQVTCKDTTHGGEPTNP